MGTMAGVSFSLLAIYCLRNIPLLLLLLRIKHVADMFCFPFMLTFMNVVFPEVVESVESGACMCVFAFKLNLLY